MAKHVLVIGDSMSLAHVGRALIIARRLRSEGASVTFATGRYHQVLARDEGFDVREIYCVPPEQAHAAIRRGSHIFDKGTVQQYVSSDLDVFEDVAPDLVVGDMRLSLNISAALSGLEYWTIVSGYLTRYYSETIKPPKTLPIVKLLGDKLSVAVFPLLRELYLRYYSFNFNRVRKTYGLDSITNIHDVIESPHRNLIADLERFVPCEGLPSSFEYVGPLIWEPSIPDPEWLHELDPETPTVYVSMGSTGDARALTDVLTLMRDAGWQVLTTVAQGAEIPPGIFSVTMARGSVLLRYANLVICHGGSGTIYQAVAHGVPIIGIPTFHDQEINLQRVEALRWGVALNPGRWQTDDLRRAIDRARTPETVTAVLEGEQLIRDAIAASSARPLLGSIGAAPAGRRQA